MTDSKAQAARRRMSAEPEESRLAELAGMPLEKLRQEFISVAEMQRQIMPDPDRLEIFRDYDIYGKTVPIAVVGGDYYDFIDLENRFDLKGKMGIVIADAAGHGLVAAMLIRDFNTALYTAISFQAYYEGDTTPLLFTKINRRMYRSSQENQFIAAFYAELHEDGKIRYVNAGHCSPLLFKEGELVTLEEGGAVLGAFWKPPQDYEVGQAWMDTGDVLVCYTDGIIEAARPDGEEYGLQRLIECIQKNRESSSRQLFDSIMQDVQEFTRGAEPNDDRTVIVIRKGLPPANKAKGQGSGPE